MGALLLATGLALGASCAKPAYLEVLVSFPGQGGPELAQAVAQIKMVVFDKAGDGGPVVLPETPSPGAFVNVDGGVLVVVQGHAGSAVTVLINALLIDGGIIASGNNTSAPLADQGSTSVTVNLQQHCAHNTDCAADDFCAGLVTCGGMASLGFGSCQTADGGGAQPQGTKCGSCGNGVCAGSSGICLLETCGCTSTFPDGGSGYAIDATHDQFCNGPDNSDTTPNACRSNCTPAHCGDGVVDTGEICDLGAQNGTGVGCNDTCDLLGQVSTLAGSLDAGELDGYGAAAEFGRPYGIALVGDDLYVLDVSFKSLRAIELDNLSPDGTSPYVQTLAGNHSPMDGTCIDGDGSSVDPTTGFCEPDALTPFDGGLLITDYGAIRFFGFSPTMDGGTLSTFSGAIAVNGNEAAGFDAGPANACIYGDPHGITLVWPFLYTNTDIDGVVAETELDQDPFLLSPVGSVGSIQEQGAMTAMNGLVYTSDSANPGNLYSYDTTNPGSGVQPITFNSIYSPPGATMQPALNSPDGICTDYKQSIYICETGFNDIKQYNLATGNVTLLAGGAPDTLAQLDGLGNQASFFDPAGCAFDPVRHVLYVSDRSGNTIRVIK